MHSMRLPIVMALLMTTACGSSTPETAPAPASGAPLTSSEVTGTVPRNAIVTLVPAEDTPPPSTPALMNQYAKQFVPNTLYVRVGQPVEFRNSEDMPHNVTVLRRGSGAEVFNVSTEPNNNYVHTFDRVGQFDVTCDIHPGMQATLIAAPGELATIADDNGHFTLPNVKPGAYKLSLNFEGRTVEQPLEVKDARTQVRVTP
jgi:plastocyanin